MAHEHAEPIGVPARIEDKGDRYVATVTDPKVNAHLLAPGMTVVVGERGELIVQPPTVPDVLAALDVAPAVPALHGKESERRSSAARAGSSLRRLLPAWGGVVALGYGELANPPQSGALSAAGTA